MKNHPLSLQIWIVIAIITLSISLLLIFFLPSTLRDFFTREVYATISSAQDLVFNQFDSNIYRDYIGPDFFGEDDQIFENIRTVRHFILYEDRLVGNISVPLDFLMQIQEEAVKQKDPSQEYKGLINGERVFYIISKGKALGRDAFIVSYMGDSYRQDLVKTLYNKLTKIMVLVLLFSWVPSILLSRYLSKPLVDLEKRVDKLASHEWQEPVLINRRDEIGKLASSIEDLRRQLIRQDEAEQSFLQHISHELKTPVMVIQSFSQAIKDGIYPKGNMEDSLDTIDEEAQRLEKKIKNLLYLTKLDYLNSHHMEKQVFSLDSLIGETVNKLSWNRKDLTWHINLKPLKILGDQDQWRIVIENLLDNQIRYGRENIDISLTQVNDRWILRVWNDGPPIEEDIIGSLFSKFNKGHKGEFGLGLAIIDKILDNHGSKIYASNEDSGVSFIIEI